MGMIPAPGVQSLPIRPCLLGQCFLPQPDHSSLPHPIPAQHCWVSLQEEKPAQGIWPVLSVGFFSYFWLGIVPLPSPLELFNLEGQRRTGKVHCVYLERECFGGKVWKTAGELVLTEGGKTQKWLKERPGRRGRAELWEWRNHCGCSKLLNLSQAPGQDQWLPAAMSSLCSLSWHSLSHPPLTTGPRAPSFLPSIPTGHILCLSLWLPGGELLKKFKIYCAFILQCYLIHGIQVGSGIVEK